MYIDFDANPTLGILAIACASVGVLFSLFRLCTKCAPPDGQQQSTTTAITQARVVTVQQQLPLTAQPATRPFTSQSVTRPSPAAQPTLNLRSTVITIDDYESPAPTYQPYLTYPPMPTPLSSPLSSSYLSDPHLAATSLSPAPIHSPMSQSQPPSYPPMTRTQSTSSEADSTPPAYSASATS